MPSDDQVLDDFWRLPIREALALIGPYVQRWADSGDYPAELVDRAFPLWFVGHVFKFARMVEPEEVTNRLQERVSLYRVSRRLGGGDQTMLALDLNRPGGWLDETDIK